jgi:predicted transcriptional regulator
VASFLAGNQIAQRDIPDLIRSVHAALADVASSAPAQAQEAPEPAVAIKKSITADFIICLEDGKKFKSLKRHLRTRYAMSPEEYRAKWGLPHDYPMVAPNYAKERSSLAKRMGLGQSRRAD